MKSRVLRMAVSFAVAVAMFQAPLAEAKAPRSLYQRMGGKKALRAVIDDFVAAAASDPKVDFTRNGQWEASASNVAHVKLMLFEFLGQAFGGPQRYSGATMRETHRDMGITKAQFDVLAGHLQGALEKHKVPKAEAAEIMTIAASTAADIVEKP
jgi:hemoglobin